MILILADSSVLLYQSFSTFDEESHEKFRFKLVDSHVLIKPKSIPVDIESYSQEQVYLEGKMAIVLHQSKPFAIFMRHGRPVCIDIGRQQAPSIASIAPFMTGFFVINKEHTSVKSAKFPPRFDPRASALKLTDGYLLKQLLFKDRGIKKVKLFSPHVSTINQSTTAAPGEAA